MERTHRRERSKVEDNERGMREGTIEREELILARLFTGPMRPKYNAVLRALGSESPVARARKEALCGTNGYETSLLLLNAALLKLGRAASPSTALPL